MLVFSPHPDDDVISMGGTLARLCQLGNEVKLKLSPLEDNKIISTVHIAFWMR